MHHLDSWIERDQLDVICFIISLFNAQHDSDVNTSILRSLRLICWVISWVVLLWFDVCWCYVVVWLGWYGIWIERDQLDVTCFIISLFKAQHVSDVNTSILRSLRLICWVISWVVLLWFDVCWCYIVVWLGWCGIWIERAHLDVTCFIISLFKAQHVSDVNTSILRSLRLICWVISWVVLLWFDVLVLRRGLAVVVWYPYEPMK